MSFKDKVVIVTGASSGIGAATAIAFGKLSANIILVARREDKLREVAKEVEKVKGKALIVKADLTNDNDVKNVVDETIKQFGKIDVLVNNAGVGQRDKIDKGIEPFDRAIATNLRSVYLLTHYAAPYLIKTKGNIVNISSVASFKVFDAALPYCISKAGLDMFTKCLAKDLAAHGVRVNSVNPGPVKSDFQSALGMNEEQAKKLLDAYTARSPLGFISTSEDIAEMIIFLASDKARSVTGSIYVVDNGEQLAMAENLNQN